MTRKDLFLEFQKIWRFHTGFIFLHIAFFWVCRNIECSLEGD